MGIDLRESGAWVPVGISIGTPPTVPLSVAAASTVAGRIDVSWAAPTSSGSSAITGYVVTITPTSGTATVQTLAPTARMSLTTGFTEGAVYTATVAAKNASGQGPSSTGISVTVARTLATGSNFLAAPATFGYPDATNTGPITTTGRTTRTGTVTLTSGQSLSKVDLTGHIIFSGSGTPPTVTDCTIYNTSGSPALDASGWSGGDIQVTDTKVQTSNTENGICITGTRNAAIGVLKLLRVDASGAQDIVHNGRGTATDCYLHDTQQNAAHNSHNDCYQPTSGQWQFVHCTMHPNNGSYLGNSVLQIGQQSGDIGDIVFDDCLLGGGNYTFNGNWSSTYPNSDPGNPNPAFVGPYAFGSLTVKNCRISSAGGANFPSRYGPRSNLNPPSGSVTWTNNVDDATGDPI